MKCGIIGNQAEFYTSACSTHLGATTGTAPILPFDVRKCKHWKFTPQCEIFPIAKSICMTKFRED